MIVEQVCLIHKSFRKIILNGDTVSSCPHKAVSPPAGHAFILALQADGGLGGEQGQISPEVSDC